MMECINIRKFTFDGIWLCPSCGVENEFISKILPGLEVECLNCKKEFEIIN